MSAGPVRQHDLQTTTDNMRNSFKFLDISMNAKDIKAPRFQYRHQRHFLGSIAIPVWLLIITLFPKAFAQQEIPDTTHITIFLSSIPSTAKVFLDSVYKGLTPLSITSSRKHKHLLRLELTDYVTHNQWISTRTDTVHLAITLIPNYSWLKIETIPANTRILIDDSLIVSSQTMTQVPVGTHNLKFENYQRGRSIECSINVNPADTICLRATLGTTSIKPVVFSILIPGAGQFYDHATLDGMGFFLGTIAAIYIGTRTNKDHEMASKAYQDSYASYLSASSENAASRFRSETLSQLDKMNSSARIKNWTFGIAAGLYMANLVDVILFHRLDDIIEFRSDSSNVSMSPLLSLDLNHLRVGIILNF